MAGQAGVPQPGEKDAGGALITLQNAQKGGGRQGVGLTLVPSSE